MTSSLIDHVVYAGPDLGALVAEFAERTGVTPVAGGVHPTGTANYLVAFTVAGARGPHYLELIGPNPEFDGPTPTTFGIDQLTSPVVATWAIHPADIAETVAAARAGGFDAGEIAPLSRLTPSGDLLEWSLTKPVDAATPLVPFLIDWGTTAHPGQSDLPTIELVSIEGEHPDVEGVRATLDLYGVEIDLVEAATPALRLVLRGPKGDIELS